ncbi:hypothetical protein PpBr36_08827 [Pyricularia pennisetigena]|uniref:hypothetical protein n=1 Tax=Pyricularia pennisetigena TaxID=1578925 RepID=UPI001152BF1B|nr:hypothetical protein PpBr36_08827 [Pyricularia pennisetigena]TLS24208.1 hypothetical protein PpBr36_08827 [Pyricularia pennisetigena]
MDTFVHAIVRRHIPIGITAPQTDEDQRILSIAILVTSSLSILGAGCIILSFATFQGLRLFRHRLILGLAISDFLRAVVILVPAVLDLANQPLTTATNYSACVCDGFMVQTFVTQSDYWILTVAIYTFIIVTGQKQTAAWIENHQLIVLAIPWVLSLASAGISLTIATYNDIGSWCWIHEENIRLWYNFVPRWTIIVAMLVMYARISVVLRKAQKGFGEATSRKTTAAPSTSGEAAPDGLNAFEPLSLAEEGGRCSVIENSNRLRKLARHMALYPIIYIIIWILPTVVVLYHVSTNTAAPFPLQTVDKSFIVIQGFVNAITYGVSESSVACWRTLLFSQDVEEIAKKDESHFFGSPGRMTTEPRNSRTSISPSLSINLARGSLSSPIYDELENNVNNHHHGVLKKESGSLGLEDWGDTLDHPAENISILRTSKTPVPL